MRVGIEDAKSFGVIEPPEYQRPPSEALFSVRPLSEGKVHIEHPFHGPKILGDGSVFSDRFIDIAAALLVDTLPYLADSRKLNRIGRFETRPYAGLFSQLSHCLSLGIMGAEFGGGPLDVFDGLYNDAPHVYSGHQGDDNYQGHGKEDLHDYTRGDFFRRSGLMQRFVDEGVLRPNGHGYHFGNTRLYIGTLLDEDEAAVRRTFMSNKHEARRWDGDRHQYGTEERLFKELFRHRNSKNPLMVPFSLIETELESVQRFVEVEDGEGDQLVFTDVDQAEMSVRDYTDSNALHWCEPVQDYVNDILNLAERYFFICDDDYARDFQYFYPRDYLHNSAIQMFMHFDEVAKRDPFMKWLLDTAQEAAMDQRNKMADVIDGKSVYRGPDPLNGLKMTALTDERVDATFSVKKDKFVIVLPKGKLRTVNPRVMTSRLRAEPLSELRPQIMDEIKMQQRWIGNYSASLQLRNTTEIEMVDRGITLIKERWPIALRRMPMTDKVFKANIADANRFTLTRH